MRFPEIYWSNWTIQNKSTKISWQTTNSTTSTCYTLLDYTTFFLGGEDSTGRKHIYAGAGVGFVWAEVPMWPWVLTCHHRWAAWTPLVWNQWWRSLFFLLEQIFFSHPRFIRKAHLVLGIKNQGVGTFFLIDIYFVPFFLMQGFWRRPKVSFRISSAVSTHHKTEDRHQRRHRFLTKSNYGLGLELPHVAWTESFVLGGCFCDNEQNQREWIYQCIVCHYMLFDIIIFLIIIYIYILLLLFFIILLLLLLLLCLFIIITIFLIFIFIIYIYIYHRRTSAMYFYIVYIFKWHISWQGTEIEQCIADVLSTLKVYWGNVFRCLQSANLQKGQQSPSSVGRYIWSTQNAVKASAGWVASPPGCQSSPV